MIKQPFEAVAIAGAVASGKATAAAVTREALVRIEAYATVQPAVWITRYGDDGVLSPPSVAAV